MNELWGQHQRHYHMFLFTTSFLLVSIRRIRNPLNSSYIFLLNVNFEKITVKSHVFYIFNTYVKFRSKWVFLYYSINKLIFYE